MERIVYFYYSYQGKCKIHKDNVNADSNLRNKQTHFVMGNGRNGSKDVATVSIEFVVAAVVVGCCWLLLLCRSRATVVFAYAISISRQLQSPNACQTQMQTQCKLKQKPTRGWRGRGSGRGREGPVTGLPHIECVLTTANKVNSRQRAFILDIKRKRIRHLKCPACRTAGSKATTEVATEASTGAGDGAEDGAGAERELQLKRHWLALLIAHKHIYKMQIAKISIPNSTL